MSQIVDLPNLESHKRASINRWAVAWRLTWRRFVLGVAVSFAVTAVTFALLSLSPMDPLRKYLGLRYQHMESAEREAVRHTLGLDAPWYQAWWDWVTSAFHGDFGVSLIYHRPVVEVVAERMPWTLLLGVLALGLAMVFSVGLGMYAGLHPRSLFDRVVTGLVAVVQSVPSFVLAVGAVFLFAVLWPILPAAGISSPGQAPTFGVVVKHLIMPVLIFAITQIPWFVLGVRESVYTAAHSPAVEAAKIRGLSRRIVVRSHVLTLSIPPAFAIMGSRLPELVVGAVVVETVFSWPGLAQALTEAALAADMALLAALTGLTTAAVIAGMWLADLLHVLLDPQVQVDA